MIICRNYRRWKTKGRAQKVVRKKCGRGGPITTRLGGWVVWGLRSCLELDGEVGINDRRIGSRRMLKRDDMVDYWRDLVV